MTGFLFDNRAAPIPFDSGQTLAPPPNQKEISKEADLAAKKEREKIRSRSSTNKTGPRGLLDDEEIEQTTLLGR